MKNKILLMILLCCSLQCVDLFSMDFIKDLQSFSSKKDLNGAKERLNSLLDKNNKNRKTTFRKIALAFHPDKNQNNSEAEEIFKTAQCIYNGNKTQSIVVESPLELKREKIKFKTELIKSKTEQIKNTHEFYTSFLNLGLAHSADVLYNAEIFGFQKMYHTFAKLVFNKLLPQQPLENKQQKVILQIKDYNNRLDKASLNYALYNDDLNRAIKNECHETKQILQKHLNRNNN